jgi:hypothetical protein
MTPSVTRRLVSLALLAWTSAILAVSVAPGRVLPDLTGKDLVAHALAYTVLAALLFSWLAVIRGKSRLSAWALAVVFAALYGAALEVVQRFVPGRDSSLADAVANTMGAVVGAGLAALALRGRAAPAGS